MDFKNMGLLMDFKNMGYSWTSKIWDTHGLQKYRILIDFKIWDTHGLQKYRLLIRLQKYRILIDFKNMGYS